MSVREQYEAFPYPERDPRDEKKRLIVGSPSHPLEVDHWVFGGARDWSKGTKILVAGGGTGDALVQLAQVLTSARKPYEITYIDLSKASRKIAESRIKARGLKGVTFITGSLLDAAKYGPFDYIDCCGVLHHLPDPQEGFDALSAALATGGGMGVMVYAPHGRSGVYPLQEAFGELSKGLKPKEKLTLAKAIFAKLPSGHPFKRNPHLVDHNASEAGFYDLLLHSQDRPFSIDQLAECLSRSGLQITGVPQPVLYDLTRFLEGADRLTKIEQMALAEKLDGTIKTHIVYASKEALKPFNSRSVPHLKGMNAAALARKIASSGEIEITLNGEKHRVTLAKESAKIISGIDGKRDLATIQNTLKLDPIAWNALWNPVETQLIQFGLLLYSSLLR